MRSSLERPRKIKNLASCLFGIRPSEAVSDQILTESLRKLSVTPACGPWDSASRPRLGQHLIKDVILPACLWRLRLDERERQLSRQTSTLNLWPRPHPVVPPTSTLPCA